MNCGLLSSTVFKAIDDSLSCFAQEMKRFLLITLGWIIGLYVLLLKATCRFIFHNDTRQAVRDRGLSHVYASLHANQIAGCMAAAPGIVAMVSRSDDGEVVLPILRCMKHTAVRGSGGAARKGGMTALSQMIRLVSDGKLATIAVDGPGGPRGRVHRGVAMLSSKTGCAVFPAIVVPQWRIVISAAWDRMQIPFPFSRIDSFFGDAMFQAPGETVEAFADRIECALHTLEKEHDPKEAKFLISRQQLDRQRIAA